MSKVAVDGGSMTSDSRLSSVMRVEWLGQMAASLCWIASVLTCGVNSVGDWLQLAAAFSWMVANVATVLASKTD